MSHEMLRRMLKQVRREVEAAGPIRPGALSLPEAARTLGVSQRRLGDLIASERVLLCDLGNRRGVPLLEMERLRKLVRKTR